MRRSDLRWRRAAPARAGAQREPRAARAGTGSTLAVGDGCPGASVDLTLEDQSVIRAERGEVRVSSVSAEAVEGTYTATGTLAGEPVAVRGRFHFTLPGGAP